MTPRWFLRLSFLINRISYAQFAACATLYAGLLYLIDDAYGSLVFFFSMVGTLGVIGVLKLVTRVERPTNCLVPLENTHRAFPSGHTGAMAFVATMMPYTFPLIVPHSAVTALGVALFALVAVVGLSRLALRAHTLTQVIAGAVVGITVPLLMIYLIDPPLAQWVLLFF